MAGLFKVQKGPLLLGLNSIDGNKQQSFLTAV